MKPFKRMNEYHVKLSTSRRRSIATIGRDDATETAPMSTVQGEADIGPVKASPKFTKKTSLSEENPGPSKDLESLETLATEVAPQDAATVHSREEDEVERLKEENKENDREESASGGKNVEEPEQGVQDEEESIEWGEEVTADQAKGEPSSADGSFSTPDDTPSIQNSITSSAYNHPRSFARVQSPTPSLRPFDRRFQSRLSPSPLGTPRALSPSFLAPHSRQSSANSQFYKEPDEEYTSESPWEVIRWTKLRRISGQAFSEIGKRNFGRPTCIAVSSSIALGTSRGMILVFDYHQSLKTIIGQGTKAVESGAVTSISLSADHSTVAGGHASGHIFTWEIARPAKPILHILPTDVTRLGKSASDGHVSGAAILHIGFLGTRNTAVVSADDKGMAFSHLATRGLGVVSRSVRTTRVLGRYPDLAPNVTRPRKPSSVIAFSPLPLGNMEHTTDSMGFVAILTPYLLVIVSTTPVAQTQHKATRPRELTEHRAMSAALAWFPSVKYEDVDPNSNAQSSNIKLAYCWSNILMLLEVVEGESADGKNSDKPPELQFKPRKRWKADEAIVAIQWLSRSVLGVMTITQQLIVLEEASFRVTDSSDLIKKHVYHVDLLSQQLSLLVEKLDEEDTSMHGVVADAFYMSFKSYKGRLFLLGFNDVSFGTLSNWADRLLALMEQGNFIAAIKLATDYYTGKADTATVGLPEFPASRHEVVREKLIEMISASLRYAFGKNPEAGTLRLPQDQLAQLANACFSACMSISDMDFLFEDVYAWYVEGEVQGILLEVLEPSIKEGDITVLPPSVLKDFIHYFVKKGWHSRLEEMLCRLNPETMDIDQITTLCKEHRLYDALFYVWNQALGDYTTILSDLIHLAKQQPNTDVDNLTDPASKIFPYLSYVLTGRIYATGDAMPDHVSLRAKAEIYHFLFSGGSLNYSHREPKKGSSFPNLGNILNIDAPSFLGVLNEAFEDSFLNDSSDNGEDITEMTAEQRFGLSLNRQYIVSILLEVMVIPEYSSEDIVYMDMFVARNLPKYPQYILLPGSVLYGVLVGLCRYSTEYLGDDCQLSAEYLLSVYQPPDLPSMVPLFAEAKFYRVMKSIYKAEKQFALLLETCFQDREDPGAIFNCITDCLKSRTDLTSSQLDSFRGVIVEHAAELVQTNISKAATIIQEYAKDLHRTVLNAIDDDEHTQYQYLKAFMEPQASLSEDSNQETQPSDSYFVELYVKLLCDYDPHHVSDYIEKLKVGDIRLEEVLPALEHSGVIDAAVVLLAREGKVYDAIDRLTKHLRTLEAALLGLLDGVESTPDPENAQESADDLAESFDKYVRVGVWLCQGQSKSKSTSKITKGLESRRNSAKSDLSPDELLWVDLLDAVVQTTRNVSEMSSQPSDPEDREDINEAREPPTITPIDNSKLLTSLRITVQTTFTALLASTSTPSANDTRHKNAAFLRILRTFLNRASLSSPSLSNLRSVLAAIFSAYSYEESLLDLANRLLDKDLFVHVAEVTALRKRGWRPLGQVCKGCGNRVWGPGAGVDMWNSWAEENKHRPVDEEQDVTRSEARRATLTSKGKAVVRSEEPEKGLESETTDQQDRQVSGYGSGALVIFSCRHVFHRTCLARMRSQALPEEENVVSSARHQEDALLACAVCCK